MALDIGFLAVVLLIQHPETTSWVEPMRRGRYYPLTRHKVGFRPWLCCILQAPCCTSIALDGEADVWRSKRYRFSVPWRLCYRDQEISDFSSKADLMALLVVNDHQLWTPSRQRSARAFPSIGHHVSADLNVDDSFTSGLSCHGGRVPMLDL